MVNPTVIFVPGFLTLCSGVSVRRRECRFNGRYLLALASPCSPSRPLELYSGSTYAVTTVRTVVPDLDGLATVGMHQSGFGMDVACAPDRQRPNHHAKFLALVGEEVFGAWRMVGVEAARNQPVLFHELEPIRENRGRNPFERGLEVLEAPRSSSKSRTIRRVHRSPSTSRRFGDRTGLSIRFLAYKASHPLKLGHYQDQGHIDRPPGTCVRCQELFPATGVVPGRQPGQTLGIWRRLQSTRTRLAGRGADGAPASVQTACTAGYDGASQVLDSDT